VNAAVCSRQRLASQHSASLPLLVPPHACLHITPLLMPQRYLLTAAMLYAALAPYPYTREDGTSCPRDITLQPGLAPYLALSLPCAAPTHQMALTPRLFVNAASPSSMATATLLPRLAAVPAARHRIFPNRPGRTATRHGHRAGRANGRRTWAFDALPVRGENPGMALPHYLPSLPRLVHLLRQAPLPTYLAGGSPDQTHAYSGNRAV